MSLNKSRGELGINSSPLCPLFPSFAFSGRAWAEVTCRHIEGGGEPCSSLQIKLSRCLRSREACFSPKEKSSGGFVSARLCGRWVPPRRGSCQNNQRGHNNEGAFFRDCSKKTLYLPRTLSSLRKFSSLRPA